jgi:hypothetical protein
MSAPATPHAATLAQVYAILRAAAQRAREQRQPAPAVRND